MKSGVKTFLPSSAKQAIGSLGQSLKLARKRRAWTIAELAQKMGVSAPTVIALEKGELSVGIGVLFSALWMLGLEQELKGLSIFQDYAGQELLSARLPQRVRSSKKRLNNDF